MRTIARLFGKSPFASFQTHMKKVSLCIKKLTTIFHHLEEGGDPQSLVEELSKLEHEADLTKNDIRAHLPKSLFLPIDRHHFLDLLSIQDSIADKAEEVGYLLTLYPLSKGNNLYTSLRELYVKNTEAFAHTRQIVKDLGDLLESSFGGVEAQRVHALADKAAHEEYEADMLKYALMKRLFSDSTELPAPALYLYAKLVEEINAISHISEKLAGRIRMILEVK
jgi:hypothetical protein